MHADATHGIVTAPACERITACDALVEVVVTDSIPQKESQQKCKKIKVISIAKLLADAIYRMHSEESLETVGQTETFMSKRDEDLQPVELLVEDDDWTRPLE